MSYDSYDNSYPSISNTREFQFRWLNMRGLESNEMDENEQTATSQCII